MKVFYTYDIFTAQKYGGISRYFVEMVKRISQKQAGVQVFAGLYINEYIRNLTVSKGLKVPPWRNTGLIRRRLSAFSQKLALLGAGEETIVHQTYYYPFTAPVKSKHIVTVYDMIHELFSEHFPSRNKESQWKKQCCHRADKIIAISNSTKSDLVNLFDIDPEKIEVIHLASSLNDVDCSIDLDQLNHDSGSDVSKPFILHVGMRAAHKNFAGLVHAFSRSEALRNDFDLLCFGDNPFSEIEKALFKELGISGSVHHLNGDDQLLAACYKKATAFVYPSLYEGFGIPLLEAMSLSCPVICSNASSIPEVVDNAGIYFDPHDPSSMQKALEDTLYNEKLLADLRTRGHARNSFFSWEKCADETLALYQSTLSQGMC